MSKPKVYKLPKSFTVSRKRWFRGRAGAALLGKDGMMCCLGFACREAGLAPSYIRGIGEPDGIRKPVVGLCDFPEEDDPTYYVNSGLATHAMHINDIETIDDKARESALRSLFRKHKYTIRFVP